MLGIRSECFTQVLRKILEGSEGYNIQIHKGTAKITPVWPNEDVQVLIRIPANQLEYLQATPESLEHSLVSLLRKARILRDFVCSSVAYDGFIYQIHCFAMSVTVMGPKSCYQQFMEQLTHNRM